jgi:hypothetical protein
MASVAERLGVEFSPWVDEVDPMSHLLRRLISDVS